MQLKSRQLPITATTNQVAELTGLSNTTLRKLARVDPDFPKPFPINARGDLRWPVPGIVEWLERRAGRPLTDV